MATMQAVMLPKKGGPEVLKTVELPLPEPGPGEVRVKVRATGVDAAFDGVGGAYTGQCVSSTRRGGIAVWYGFAGAQGLPAIACSALSLFVAARLHGRRGTFYGITMLYRKNPRPFREDLPKLFDLLAQGEIAPRIAETLPVLDARKANEQLEAGGIDGKLVLVALENSPVLNQSFQATAACGC